MPFFNFLFQDSGLGWFNLVLVAAWTIFWQGLALWRAAGHNQKNWFIALLILNALGLLPIIYLIWFKPQPTKKSTRKIRTQINSELTP